MTQTNYEIILFYKYTSIKDPKSLTLKQQALCEKLSLKGRLLIASEGINGTLEGTRENINVYCDELISDEQFKDIVFKRSSGKGDAFPKLKVKLRNEIVSSHLGAKDVKPYNLTGKRLSADELQMWRDKNKDFVIVDMRNEYEYKVGHFENSINPKMSNFRDLEKATEALKEDLKDKTVVTVCTGGVRCEKASGYLLSQGFNDVYQLQDGIVTYMEKYPNKGFKGKLYVFDNRITMDFDTEDNHTVVGRCDICEGPTEEFVNCKNKQCNAHILICADCKESKDGFCSERCRSFLYKEKTLS